MHQVLVEFAELVGRVLAGRWMRLQEQKPRNQKLADIDRPSEPGQDTLATKLKHTPRT
jgi:hypothetical protein